MKKKFNLLLCVLTILSFISCAKKEKNILIVLSADGFRHAYLQDYNTPNIDSLIKVGVSARMKASYPSQTFPNHYTLATGLYPDHHGIVSNKFYDDNLGEYLIGREMTRDGRFYGGEPIWNTVAKQNKQAITYYWVGSEAAVNGTYPQRWFLYDKKIPFTERADTIFAAINRGEVDLAMLYIEEPDHNGHSYGPTSEQAKQAVEMVDEFVGYILKQIRKSPYKENISFLMVADHGMTTIHSQYNLVDLMDENDIERCYTGSICNIYLKDKSKQKEIIEKLNTNKGLKAYAPQDVPKRFHYGSNPRVGDIIIVPELGVYINYNKDTWQKGTHGYDNDEDDMKTILLGLGPKFSKGMKYEQDVENVNVYPLMCRILGIKPSPNDGSEAVVDKLLKK